MSTSKNLMQNAKKVPLIVYEIIIVFVLFVLGEILVGNFFTFNMFRSLLVLSCFLGITAGGQTVCILLGAIDLSVPGIIGMANVLSGYFTSIGWPFGLSVLVVFLLAAGIGAANGFATKRFNINPMIMTMATSSIIQGITFLIVNGKLSGTVPKWVNQVVALGGHMGPVKLPPVILIWAAYAVCVILMIYKSRIGKKIYATGTSIPAADLALVNTNNIWLFAFIFSAGSAALAGILLAGFSGSAYFAVGSPYMFNSISAVVIGGTSLLGGRGGYDRSIIGSIVIILLSTILIGMGFGEDMKQIMLGIVIFIMLALYGRQKSIAMRI